MSTPRRKMRAGNVMVWARPTLLDDTVIDEVATRNEYRMDWQTLHGATVIDLGANIGIFSALCAQAGAHVWAVEPQPENAELWNLNLQSYEHAKLFAAAMGATTGTTFIAGESGGAHVEPDHPDAIEIEQITLASLLDDIPLDHVDVLKLDMEGSEADTLLACDREHLARVGRIVMETHGPSICPWVLRPRVGELVEHLLPTHNVETSGFPTHLGKLFATRNGCRP